jgi:hypothetical protein
MSQVDCIDYSACFISIFGPHDPIATRESGWEFLEQNANAFSFDSGHFILCADAKNSRDKFDKGINVAGVF